MYRPIVCQLSGGERVNATRIYNVLLHKIIHVFRLFYPIVE